MIHFHDWAYDQVENATERECIKCHRREYRSKHERYGEYGIVWLEFGSWTLLTKDIKQTTESKLSLKTKMSEADLLDIDKRQENQYWCSKHQCRHGLLSWCDDKMAIVNGSNYMTDDECRKQFGKQDTTITESKQ